MKSSIRHYYPDCSETEVYPSGECKKCKNSKNREYAQTDHGKLVIERCVTKQRLNRKLRQLSKILLDVEKDLASVDSPDSAMKQDLEHIHSTMQRICIQNDADPKIHS